MEILKVPAFCSKALYEIANALSTQVGHWWDLKSTLALGPKMKFQEYPYSCFKAQYEVSKPLVPPGPNWDLQRTLGLRS
jgi:hypothetical protein